MASKKLRQETIVWRDSWQGYDARPIEPNEVEDGYFLTDTGWLVKETRDEVLICTSRSADPTDDRVKYIHGIPKKAIISRSSRWVRIPDPRKH